MRSQSMQKWMQKLIPMLLLAGLLGACGGGSGSTTASAGGGADTTPASTGVEPPAQVTVVSSN